MYLLYKKCWDFSFKSLGFYVVYLYFDSRDLFKGTMGVNKNQSTILLNTHTATPPGKNRPFRTHYNFVIEII